VLLISSMTYIASLGKRAWVGGEPRRRAEAIQASRARRLFAEPRHRARRDRAAELQRRWGP
jgi:hypothetical protein